MLKFRASSAAGYAYLTTNLFLILQLATLRDILQTTDMRHNACASLPDLALTRVALKVALLSADLSKEIR